MVIRGIEILLRVGARTTTEGIRSGKGETACAAAIGSGIKMDSSDVAFVRIGRPRVVVAQAAHRKGIVDIHRRLRRDFGRVFCIRSWPRFELAIVSYGLPVCVPVCSLHLQSQQIHFRIGDTVVRRGRGPIRFRMDGKRPSHLRLGSTFQRRCVTVHHLVGCWKEWADIACRCTASLAGLIWI